MTNTKEVKKKTKTSSTVIATVKAKSTKKGGDTMPVEKKFQYIYNRIQTGKRIDGQSYNYMKNEYVKPIFSDLSKAKLTQLDKHLTAILKTVYIVEGKIYNMEHPTTNDVIEKLQLENKILKAHLERATKATKKKQTKVAKETK